MTHRTNRAIYDKGFTLVEVLVALAISALLLAAVATALNASLMNYSENQSAYEAMSRARQALGRISTQLRTCDSVDPLKPANQCEFILADTNEVVLYEYLAANEKLVMHKGGNEYDLCTDVGAMTFSKQTNSEGVCTSVRISMTVNNQDTSQDLASAVVIRRSL